MASPNLKSLGVRKDVYEAAQRIAKIRGVPASTFATEVLGDFCDDFFARHKEDLQELAELQDRTNLLRQRIGANNA